MPNRQMQAKAMKARGQAAAYALNVKDRETYHDTTAIETVTLEDIIAAYKGPIRKCETGKRTIAAERHVYRTIVTR